MRKSLFVLAALALGLSAHAQTYTESTLHAFPVASPVGSVTVDSAGNLYGALDWTSACQPGKATANCGTIFKLNAGGKETVLHQFSGLANGASPVAPLTRDAAGNLYGVTKEGGIPSSTLAYGHGVVFKITPQGQFSVLHKFAASGAEGALPSGPLTIDSAGNLYGTAAQGGNLSSCSNGCGVVFKVTSKGVFSVLHAFTETDGFLPRGNLILDSAGNLYGTTTDGGPDGGFNSSYGVLFELTPHGQYAVLSAFDSGVCFDDCAPSYIVRDSAGNFFGIGYDIDSGGFNNGGIFEVTPSGTQSVVNNLCFGVDTACPNGAEPFGQIVESAGLLYGTAETGGGATQQEFGQGVVYEQDPATSAQTVLYSFPTQSGGLCNPQGITMDAKGNLYGTATYCYGVTGGVVFKLTKSQ